MIVETPSTSGSLADRAALAFRAYVDGDNESMGELIELLTPLLWHVARSQRVDQGTAEDVVQTAWLRLVEHAGRLHDAQSVMKWLVVTVRRESWRLVSLRRATDLGLDDGLLDESRSEEAVAGPEIAVVLGDEQRRLWDRVAALPQRCQALIRVIAFGDRPDYSTLAEALGMPVGSIGPTRGRCLAKLRALLEQDGTWKGRFA